MLHHIVVSWCISFMVWGVMLEPRRCCMMAVTEGFFVNSHLPIVMDLMMRSSAHVAGVGGFVVWGMAFMLCGSAMVMGMVRLVSPMMAMARVVLGLRHGAMRLMVMGAFVV